MLTPTDLASKEPHQFMYVWLKFKHRDANTFFVSGHYTMRSYAVDGATGQKIKLPFCPLASHISLFVSLLLLLTDSACKVLLVGLVWPG